MSQNRLRGGLSVILEDYFAHSSSNNLESAAAWAQIWEGSLLNLGHWEGPGNTTHHDTYDQRGATTSDIRNKAALYRILLLHIVVAPVCWRWLLRDLEHGALLPPTKDEVVLPRLE